MKPFYLEANCYLFRGKMIVSNIQIRSARASLNLDLKEIEAATGIIASQLSGFENDKRGIGKKKLSYLVHFFEDQGIIFTENDGIQRKPKGSVRTLEGADGFKMFKRDVRQTAMNDPQSCNICISNVDERLFIQWGGEEDTANHRAVMAKLPNLKCRILSREGDTYLVAAGYAEYRWLPKSLYDNIPIYIYGNKTALISFGTDTVIVFIIDHKDVADFHRKSFKRMWEKASPVK